MPTYERSTRVAAPFAEVWEFHSTVRGLIALTPDWMNLEVESVRGPEGDPDPDELEVGAVVTSSIRPFGLGPRLTWVSEITGRGRSDGTGYFRDVMTDGPFPRWVHTHAFYADGEETIVRDRVEYRLPLGGIGDTLGSLAAVGFEPMFRYRHRKTRELLE